METIPPYIFNCLEVGRDCDWERVHHQVETQVLKHVGRHVDDRVDQIFGSIYDQADQANEAS
jgi:predicted small metal-binding protein